MNDFEVSEFFKETYRLEGQALERERIIKLLEDYDDSNLWRQVEANAYEGFNIRELIELIKGEQK